MSEKITGGAAVVEVLRELKVDAVFGLLGGSMLELYDALHAQSSIRYVGARDERAAAHMADAYARIRGIPGVVLGAQAGPGVANLVTGVAQAHLAYSPLIAIAGAITRGDQGKDTFQEIDQVALFAPIAKKSIMVPTAERLPELLWDAARIAMSARRGPVVLHVPRDLFAQMIPPPTCGPLPMIAGAQPNGQQLAEVLELLAAAHRPVIFAGAGFKSSAGATALRELAETLAVPVVCSTGHADIMAHGHPLNAGQAGPRGNTVASGLTRDADLILALGTRLAFNSTFHSNDYVGSRAKLVQIDNDAHAIGRYFPVTLGIQANAIESAGALRQAWISNGNNASGWREWSTKFVRDHAALLDERRAEACLNTVRMHPRRALAEIRAVLPHDAIVTLDTGNACLQAADRLAHFQTPGLLTPLDFGLVGFGFAAALGAKVAAPERPVICVMGDGGFGYTLSEVATAVQHGIAVVAVVLDNGAWGAEKAYQREFFGGRTLGAELLNPPFDKMADLAGARGYRASNPSDLAKALQSALAAAQSANITSIIHTFVDPEVLSTLRKDLFTSKPDK